MSTKFNAMNNSVDFLAKIFKTVRPFLSSVINTAWITFDS